MRTVVLRTYLPFLTLATLLIGMLTAMAPVTVFLQVLLLVKFMILFFSYGALEIYMRFPPIFWALFVLFWT